MALRHPRSVMLILLAVLGLNFYLYDDHPEGLLPAAGYRPADRRHPGRPEHLVPADAAEADAVRHHRQRRSGGRYRRRVHRRRQQTNSGFVFVSLQAARRAQGLRRPGDRAAAARAGAGAGRDAVPAGGAGHPRRRPRRAMRSISTRCRADASRSSTNGRRRSRPRCSASRISPTSTSDQQNKGLETDLVIDRDTAARLGITVSQIDNTLYDAFGQRQVSTIYSRAQPVSRHHGGGAAILAEPGDAEGRLRQHLRRRRSAARRRPTRSPAPSSRPGQASAAAIRSRPMPRAISRPIRSAPPATARSSTGSAVSTSAETMIPLSARRHASRQAATPLAVNHQGLLVATTISFNLPPGASLSDAVTAIEATHEPDRRAGHDPRHLPGHRASLPGFARATSRT